MFFSKFTSVVLSGRICPFNEDRRKKMDVYNIKKYFKEGNDELGCYNKNTINSSNLFVR
jgi:hypothetical protein